MLLLESQLVCVFLWARPGSSRSSCLNRINSTNRTKRRGAEGLEAKRHVHPVLLPQQSLLLLLLLMMMIMMPPLSPHNWAVG